MSKHVFEEVDLDNNESNDKDIYGVEGKSLKVTKNISKMKIVSVDDSIALNSWMEDNYVDSAPVFDSLNIIPATHNSAAIFPRKVECCVPWLWAKCQGYTIRDQLNIGIRCFDLRLKLIRDENGNRYQIVHYFESTYTFSDVMLEINDFLDNNDGETVFVMIKPDWNTRKNWRFSDLDDLWNYIKNRDRVLKLDDEMNQTNIKNVKLHELRFADVRGKIIMMPNGHIYDSYNNTSKNSKHKVNRGRDIDVIHGVKIMYPNFLNRCENWNSHGVRHTKQRIESFLTMEKQRASSVERRMEGDESNMYPLIETNVVLFKGTIPPYLVSKCMHPYLKSECSQSECITDKGMCYVNRMGFALLDFANESLVRKLLSNNWCKYY